MHVTLGEAENAENMDKETRRKCLGAPAGYNHLSKLMEIPIAALLSRLSSSSLAEVHEVVKLCLHQSVIMVP